MDNYGFILIGVILSLFLLGLITVTCLPILNTSFNNLRLADIKRDMVSTAEIIMEQIKSFDYNNEIDGEYVFDIELENLIETLGETNQVDICLPVDPNKKEYKYFCHINKKEMDKLWEVKVNVGPIKNIKGIKNVEITGILPIPKK